MAFNKNLFSFKRNVHETPTQRVHVYHIAYSEETRQKIMPGSILLDNTHSMRHDWREYWPIRKFLTENKISDESYYGFFSPRFTEKTGLTHAAVLSYVQAVGFGADIISFCPQPDQSAFFLNVFEQQESFDPGFIECCDAFFQEIGLVFDIKSTVMDSRQTIFSNYFIAKPKFWRAWSELCEEIFDICEGNLSPLKSLLLQNTEYPGGVQRKVFLIERIASLLLSTNKSWKVSSYNPFKLPWSIQHVGKFPFEAVVCDSLKIAMQEQGFSQYLEAFRSLQKMVNSQQVEKDSN
jgi:hypothetical protein